MAITVGGSTITMNSGSVIQDPPGSAPSYLCRAWVNFNGSGTVSVRASGNVSSITDNNVGDYTVNFSNAMIDGNYSVVTTSGTFNSSNGTAATLNIIQSSMTGSVTLMNTSQVRLASTLGTQSSFQDNANLCVSIFR